MSKKLYRIANQTVIIGNWILTLGTIMVTVGTPFTLLPYKSGSNSSDAQLKKLEEEISALRKELEQNQREIRKLKQKNR